MAIVLPSLKFTYFVTSTRSYTPSDVEMVLFRLRCFPPLLNGAMAPPRHCANRVLAAIGVGFLLTVVGFKVVVPEDPYAMLDDTYLNTLKNDDDIANDAARQVCLWWGVSCGPLYMIAFVHTDFPASLPTQSCQLAVYFYYVLSS